MSTFLEKIRSGPRIIAVTGQFGSGKTEFAVSLAFALAQQRADGENSKERLALADLDLENPYFRSREKQDSLERAGVRVYSDPFNGRNGSELQTISSTIRAPLEDSGCRVLLDAGGGASGARILNQFKKYFTEGAYQMLCVVNPYRPGSTTPEEAAEQVRSVASATGLAVSGLIANGHLIRETTPSEVLFGWSFTRQVSRLCGVPVLCACCMESLLPEVEARDVPLFPIGMYMRESYLDRKV